MRFAIVLLLLATPGFAQDQAAIASAACGPKNAAFEVKEDKTQHTLAQPAPGKALVYIISTSGLACDPGGWCLMRVGLDGTWVGVFKGTPPSFSNGGTPGYDSYFYALVDPGEHHVCASAQLRKNDLVVLSHFTAEAGKVYFLGTGLQVGLL